MVSEDVAECIVYIPSRGFRLRPDAGRLFTILSPVHVL